MEWASARGAALLRETKTVRGDANWAGGPDFGDELTVTLTTDEIPNGRDLSAARLSATLPQVAGTFAQASSSCWPCRRSQGEACKVSAVTIRVVQYTVLGEVTVSLPDGTEVFT